MKRLILAAVMLALTGCSTTRVAVSNPAPAPWFLACDDILWMRDHGAPEEVIGDMVRQTNVMLKLRALQPEKQRENLGKCAGPVRLIGIHRTGKGD